MSGPARTQLGDNAAADVANGMTVSDVAKKYGLTSGSVSKMCRIRGVNGPNVRGPDRRKRMVDAVKSGRTMTDVAKEFGVSVGTISRACRDFGLKAHRVWTTGCP